MKNLILTLKALLFTVNLSAQNGTIVDVAVSNNDFFNTGNSFKSC